MICLVYKIGVDLIYNTTVLESLPPNEKQKKLSREKPQKSPYTATLTNKKGWFLSNENFYLLL